jgi:hypothetical protein
MATATATRTAAATVAALDAVTASTTAPRTAVRTANGPVPLATPAIAPVTVEDLRNAVATFGTAAAASDSAKGSLASLVLARYAHHAARYARTIDGVAVLPVNDRDEVRTLIWLDAIGRTKAPKGDELADLPAAVRKAVPSINQYVSRMGTVATDLNVGIDYLTGTDAFNEAEKTIKTRNAAAAAEKKEREAKREAESALNAFDAYLDAAPADVRAALVLSLELMSDPNGTVVADGFKLDVKRAA